MTDIVPFSREELAALRARAEKGDIPSLDEIRRFVHTTRVSYLAAESRGKPKSRTAKPKADESDAQIDFF